MAAKREPWFIISDHGRLLSRSGILWENSKRMHQSAKNASLGLRKKIQGGE